MSSRVMSGRRKTFGVNEKVITLRIFPDAANPPSFTSTGGVASVARVSAGLYRITLQDAYFSCVGKHATYMAPAATTDMYAQFQAMANLGTANPVTADVALKTGAANTEAAAANANNHIDVEMVFEDSSV
jgi:hypothetical protein